MSTLLTIFRPFQLFLLILALGIPSATALAGTIVVTMSATVSNTSGDLTGPVSNGDTISGTFELDDSVVGVFTPSPNPMFDRSEMLYTGAVISSTVLVNGNPVSGLGGDVKLLDATDMFAGEDNYEISAVVDTGSIGGATPATLVFVAELDYTTFTISSGDPLFPPPFDATRFNPITLTSSTGGTAFGQIDTLSASGAPSVPLASPIVGLAIVLLLAVVGSRFVPTRSLAR